MPALSIRSGNRKSRSTPEVITIPAAGIEWGDQTLDEVGGADAVVVDQHQRLRRGSVRTDVHRRRKPGVVVESNDLGEVVSRARCTDGTPGGVVVDDDRLVRDRLDSERVEQTVEPAPGRRL